ncbi:MAG: carboxypeptidase-like regulatory domain-containing protein, partial [Planctomycetota bacterium]
VTIEPQGEGETIRVTTNKFGRFLTRLAPGDYTVTVRTNAYPEYTEEWTIDPLEATIWLEKAKVIAEPENDAEFFAWYGRNMTLILEE